MKKLIFLKYGELNTKKGNIKVFIDALYKNINHKLSDCNVIINRNTIRTYIELNEDNESIVIGKLKEIFGIQSIVIAYRIDTNIDEIMKSSLEIMKTKPIKTFKIITKRSFKQFPMNSMEVSTEVGGYVIDNIPSLTVDVHNPDYALSIELRDNYTYLYIEEIKGLGGYPCGIQGKGLLMLSGGIDSPVAGFLSLKRGITIECLYFDSPPHTSLEALNKVKKLCEILSKYSISIELHIVPFTKLQETIYKNVNPTYMITIMRRMMYRISEKFALSIGANAIINGESIGQVASQTLTSMSVINAVTNMPVIRPVACYDTSILPYEDCCTIFVPEHPVINPILSKCIEEESKFEYEILLDECLENIKTIKIEEGKSSLNIF